MLMVTTTVRMVNGVHSNTSNDWESLSESLEFVEKNTSFHDWFFISASASNNSDSCSAASRDGLSRSGWESDSGPWTIIRVPHNSGVGSCASWIWSFVSNSWFDVADGGTFSNLVDWKDVADWDSCFTTTENVLAWVCSFGGEEVFGPMFVSIGVPEINFEEGGSSSGVVDYSPDNSFNISLPFGKVKITISWRCNSLRFGSFVDSSGFTFPLTWIISQSYFLWSYPLMVINIIIKWVIIYHKLPNIKIKSTLHKPCYFILVL